MTTYAKITDFASKDALLTGNPAKIVKGVEIDDEFNAIATADATSVKGPIGATVDNTVVRWDGTTGRAVQGSGVTISDVDVLTAPTLSVTGNTTLGDASTDTVTVNGYMGVGGAGSPLYGLHVVPTALTTASQSGIVSRPVATSAATGSITALVAQAGTAATSFTTGAAYGVLAQDASKGAGSTITNQHGLYVADQTQGTNNYGITSLVSSGTNKWNIYASGTAANYFAGNVGIGGTSSGGKLEIINAGTVNWLLNNTTGAVQTAAYASSTKGSVGTVTNHSLTLFTNNTDRVTIDTAGNLGLGVTPSASTLASTQSAYGISIGNNEAHQTKNAYYNAGWKYVATTTAARFSVGEGGNDFRWYTAPSGTAGNAITFAQSLAVGLGTTLALEGATSASGTGIAFPATQLASSNANTLDDYEEGTFTPTIAGTGTAGAGTYSAQAGFYTKVGNIVHWNVRLSWSAHTGTGNMTIGSLPFTSNGTANNQSACDFAYDGLTVGAGKELAGYVNVGATSVILVACDQAGGSVAALVMDTAVTYLIANGSYKV